MIILPKQLNGKTVADCYVGLDGTLTFEFTDGTKVEIQFEEIDTDYFEVQIETVI